MSTTVSDKIAEIKTEIDVGTVTDAMLLSWLNQFEGGIYDDIKTYNQYYYKTFYLPYIKDQNSYMLKNNFLVLNDYKYFNCTPSSKDIVNVHIWDSDTEEFKECKKIDHRSDKKDGYYYWFDNNIANKNDIYVSKLCLSYTPNITNYIYGAGTGSYSYLIEMLSTYITFTENSLTTTQSFIPVITDYQYVETGIENINFDDYLLTGAKVELYGCDDIGANGEFIISNIDGNTITFEGSPFIPGTANINSYIVLRSCALGRYMDHRKINDIKENDYICIGGSKADPATALGVEYPNIDWMYWQTYTKCIYLTTGVISLKYGSLNTNFDQYLYLFKPGIKITYIEPYSKKLIDNIATDTLILSEKYEAAYNYFLAAKIHEMQKEYTDAEIKFAKAIDIIESLKDQYKNTEENYPADNQIIAEW